MAEPRLVHVGNVLVDIVLYVPTLPEPGGDRLARSGDVTVGGGFNVLAAAHRQGMPVVYGGTHGTGPFADLCRTRLAEEGIDVAHAPLSDLDTGYTVAMVDDSGERTFVTNPGAEAHLTGHHLSVVDVRPDDVVYVSGYGLAYRYNGPALAAWMSTIDATVIVDPGPLLAGIPAPVLAVAVERADWWSCNEREARIGPVGHRGVIVRRGADGCDVTVDGQTVHVPGFAVDVVDTNGAGDTHCGVFAAALSGGLTPVAAARRANAAAAIAVTRHGPATAPTVFQVDRFLGARG